MLHARSEDTSDGALGADIENSEGGALLLRAARYGKWGHWLGEVADLGSTPADLGKFPVWCARDAAIRGVPGKCRLSC